MIHLFSRSVELFTLKVNNRDTLVESARRRNPEDSVMTLLPGPSALTQPVDLREDRPTPARMYDYFLGGKDNYAVDRAAADRVREAVPNTREIVWENRFFLQRAVRYLAAAGIDQFIDLGAGLLAQGNVHEIARQVSPGARVVYVDNDPIVLAYGRGLLADSPNTAVLTADMREPSGIIASPDLRSLIDFSRPRRSSSLLCSTSSPTLRTRPGF
jgi:S-adenosyl methyltransferase